MYVKNGWHITDTKRPSTDISSNGFASDFIDTNHQQAVSIHRWWMDSTACTRPTWSMPIRISEGSWSFDNSCTRLIDMLHHWSSALDNGKSARVLFVDFAKAFDHVDHSTVLQKLRNYGVPKFIIDWLASFLTHRQQRVKIANVYSVHGLDHSSFWIWSMNFASMYIYRELCTTTVRKPCW